MFAGLAELARAFVLSPSRVVDRQDPKETSRADKLVGPSQRVQEGQRDFVKIHFSGRPSQHDNFRQSRQTMSNGLIL